MKHTPNPYAINAVRQGYYSTHVKARNERDVVPFKIQMGRDNLYQRMYGLPKYTKEQLKEMAKKHKHKVEHIEFLPNSIVNTPKKKLHSNSMRTHLMGLYHVRSLSTTCASETNRTMTEPDSEGGKGYQAFVTERRHDSVQV